MTTDEERTDDHAGTSHGPNESSLNSVRAESRPLHGTGEVLPAGPSVPRAGEGRDLAQSSIAVAETILELLEEEAARIRMLFGGWWGIPATPVPPIEPLPENCPECRGLGAVAKTTLITGETAYIGHEILTGGGQIRIWSGIHNSPIASEFKLQTVLANWLLTLPFKLVARSRITYDSLRQPDYEQRPPLQKSSRTRWHRTVSSNVFLLMNHLDWPEEISTAMKHEAQWMVGYFFQHPVSAEQMYNLTSYGSDRGIIDNSVVMHEEAWVEPFVMTDTCEFCQAMTDTDVTRRVDAFQWAVDKELYRYGTDLDGDYPNFRLYKTIDERKEFHRLVKVWEESHSKAFKLIDLTALPHYLQRILCIKWNHIVRDFLAKDLRYIHHDDNYYVIDTIPITPSVFVAVDRKKTLEEDEVSLEVEEIEAPLEDAASDDVDPNPFVEW